MKTDFLVVADCSDVPYGTFFAYCDGSLAFSCRAAVGKNGVSANRTEGDKTTPLGVHKLGQCFGLLPVPEKINIDLGDGILRELSMSMPYHVIEDCDYWNGDFNVAPYNAMVSCKDMPCGWDVGRCEHLADFKVSYNYCSFIEFNKDNPVDGKGAAIFLHCTNPDFSGTAGCVAIPEEFMLKALFLINEESTIKIVHNMDFSRVKYEDADKVAPYFALRHDLSCDTTPFNMLFWSYYYGIDACFTKDALLWVMESEWPVNELCAGIPICKPELLEKYVGVLHDYFTKILGKRFVISCIDTELPAVESVLRARNVSYEVTEYRDNADYIYLAESLRTLSGKSLHGKKNMCNAFEKKYVGRYEYRELSESDSDVLIGFLRKWTAERSSEEQESLDYEISGLKHAFSHDKFKELSVKLGGVFIDGELCAFTLGSFDEKNKLAVIHFEKALRDYHGLYQFINREFLRNSMRDALLVNREDDLGIEGLRQAKLSYKPSDFCRKYIVRG